LKNISEAMPMKNDLISQNIKTFLVLLNKIIQYSCYSGGPAPPWPNNGHRFLWNINNLFWLLQWRIVLPIVDYEWFFVVFDNI